MSLLTQDWHPAAPHSFASSHPGSGRRSTPFTAAYGPQVLWPDHCVQGSVGAALHPAPRCPHAALVLRKGFRSRDRFPLSAFYENDRTTPTRPSPGTCASAAWRGVFLAGLAFDFCVRWSAEDARRLGFEAIVIEDACRGIDLDGSLAATRASFAERGVVCVGAREVGWGKNKSTLLDRGSCSK